MLVAALAPTAAGADGAKRSGASAVVVANRGSGDISVIDPVDRSVTNYDLPGDAEPMYVNHDPVNGTVLVGDRASSNVVVLDDETYEVIGSVAVGEGIFHQWLDARRGRLWVVGTAAATVTVVDTASLTARATFSVPADLIERGGVTHDVFVKGNHAFVSVLGLDDGSGAVLRYSARTLELTGRIETGGDPHLFVDRNRLYVASQDASTVTSYRVSNLAPLASADVPAAHGIFVIRDRVVVTNIAGGGTDAVWLLDGRTLAPTLEPVDTSVATPHNVAVTADGVAYVTHSGPTADAVSVIDADSGVVAVLTVGTNPFGLAVVS